MSALLEPFSYEYMVTAMWVSALVGATCAFLSAFLMLKGWSLMGDAMSHAIVPGVAAAYILGLPYSFGAFIAGGLAAGAITLVRQRTALREDAVIGLVFTSFFAFGLLLLSIRPAAVDIQTIALGNILAIAPGDAVQMVAISLATLALLGVFWRDLLATFFDEDHARSVGVRVGALKTLFFALLAACTVAALQAVGAFLVIAMVITPGATAYLLTDRFSRLVAIAMAVGAGSSFAGVYASYFLDAATGGVIIVLQTLVFIGVFVFAPRHGLLANRRVMRGGQA